MKKILILISAVAFFGCSTTRVVNLDRSRLVPALDSLTGLRVSVMLRGDSTQLSRTLVHVEGDSLQLLGSGNGYEQISLDKILWVDLTTHVDYGKGALQGCGVGTLIGAAVFSSLCALGETDKGYIPISPAACGVFGVFATGPLGLIIGGAVGHRDVTRYQEDSSGSSRQ